MSAAFRIARSARFVAASVFRRYDIVDVEDVRQALRKTERCRETRTDLDNQRVVRL